MDVSCPIISCHIAAYYTGLMDMERENMLSPSFKSAHSHLVLKALSCGYFLHFIKC